MSSSLTEHRFVILMINCSKTENDILFSFVFVCGVVGDNAFQYFSKFTQISNLYISDLSTRCFLMSVSFWLKNDSKVCNSLQFTLNVSGAAIRPLSQWQMPTFFPV